MQSKPAFWRRMLIPALFVFLSAGLFLATKFVKTTQPQAVSKQPAERTSIPGRAPALIGDTDPAIAVKRPETEQAQTIPLTFALSDSGSEKTFALSLEEISIRDGDGKDHPRPLVPPATAENYVSRIRDFENEGQVLPVLYPEGEEPTPFNRRLVTSSVLAEAAEDTDRAALPQALGLATETVPEGLPKHVVLSARSPLAALAGLNVWRALPDVRSVQVLLAKQQAKRTMPTDPLVPEQWHLKYQNQSGAVAGTDVNVESVWNFPSTTAGTFFRGSGIRIGVIDDGLEVTHPDLKDNVDTAIDKDYNNNDSDPSPGTGDDHGTSCAGNAAAKAGNGIGVSGTAPDATLVGMRLIAAATTDAQEADAMTYRGDVIQVKTNSWGPSDTGKVLEAPGTLTKAALASATSTGRGGLGSIILWAGGNGGDVGDNSNYDGYANSIHTIAIGATDSQNRRAYYSEPGANLIVCAPSSGRSPALGITTVDRSGTSGYNSVSSASGGDYCDDFGGTSSATPTAAGIVALMLQKKPGLGWRDVQEILIRSAKRLNNSSSGWATNGAGFRFNHDYGAGLIDAAAAVNLAATWTNLPAQTSTVSTQSGLSLAIPENNANGITRTFSITPNIRAEQVTVRLTVNHTSRGNLAITLTSPTGMTSNLTEVHSDAGDHYPNWTLMSARHWGETAAGDWTLKIADRSAADNATGGTLTAAELTVFGTPGVATNPPPVVQVTSPTTGAIFSPNAIVNVSVSATDTVIGGGAGVVSQVQLLDNGSVVATDSIAPYTFSISLALGTHALTAKATDSEGTVTESATVSISLVNQPPVITAAAIGGSPAYDDTPLIVTGITASDPDGTTPTISYQWQSSMDGVNFTDVPGLTTATLPADPARSGLIWRCALTASDGALTSAVFYTNAVNLLDRPVTSVAAGASYSYQSGLVLRSGGGGAARDAIINEFSQGPSGGTSEWVEILVLKTTSLRKWGLKDTAGGQIVFQDTVAWDSVPAGTRIIIYNSASKDGLLPIDDTNFSDLTLVVPSNNPTFFSTTLWPALGNSGDGIYLTNAAGATVAQVGYGNDIATGVNVGAVSGGRSAYYAGGSDEGAGVAANWKVTTSLTARAPRESRALGDLFFSEYVEGSGNNKALEIYNPSAGTVNLATDSYKIEIYSNGSSSVSNNISLTGSIAPGSTHVIVNSGSSSALLALGQQTSGSLGFNGNDAIVLKKGAAIVDGIGQTGVNPPGEAWTAGGVSTLNRTIRRKPTVVEGDVIANNAFDPSVEWDGFAVDTFSGLGSHSAGSSGSSLFLTVSPNSFSESGGAGIATGTLIIAEAIVSDLVITLASSDLTEATVPATATILAGQTSVTFPVAAVDDSDADGSQSVTITASAASYSTAAFIVTTTDDEVSLEGVTPGKGNTPANTAWIATLQSGTAGNPALFRLATGSSLPSGLSLDAETGLISGTVEPAASGTFTVVIERYNAAGEVVSQSFTLEISGGGGVPNYAIWIAGFPGISNPSAAADSDNDGLSNLLEYYLGLAPNLADAVNAIAVSKTATKISITYSRSLNITGVNARVEWSDTLAADSWVATGLTEEILGTTSTDQIVRTSLTISASDPKKFLRLKVTLP